MENGRSVLTDYCPPKDGLRAKLNARKFARFRQDKADRVVIVDRSTVRRAPQAAPTPAHFAGAFSISSYRCEAFRRMRTISAVGEQN